MPTTRIAVLGTGAIGGVIGAFLCRHAAASDGNLVVTLVARGVQIHTMKADGLTVIMKRGFSDEGARTWLVQEDGLRIFFADSEDADEMASAGPQDYVLSTLKGHGLLPALADIQPLLGPETTFVTLHNGLPFCYFHGGGPGCPPELEGRSLQCLDPDRVLENGIGMGRCLCGNAYIGAAKLRPGVIECNGAGHIPIGEPSGVMSPRLLALESLLNDAGLGARAHPDIRREHPVLINFQNFVVLQTHAYCNFHSWSCR